MTLINEPQNPGWWQIGGKTWIWLLIGIVLAFLVFAILSVLGTDFFVTGDSMFMALVFIIIACVVTIIGMGIFSGLLSMMFSSDYYDFGKMFGFSVLANGLLVLLFLPLYLMMSDTIDSLMIVYAFHVMFWFFISYVLLEFTTNPNYSASNLMWWMLGFGITLVVYMMIYSFNINNPVGANNVYIYVLSPFLISYVCVPLFHGIWTQIYYGIYSSGNNPLFVPQLSDVTQTQEEVDEVNVTIQ